MELADRIVMKLTEPIDVDGGTRVMVSSLGGLSRSPRPMVTAPTISSGASSLPLPRPRRTEVARPSPSRPRWTSSCSAVVRSENALRRGGHRRNMTSSTSRSWTHRERASSQRRRWRAGVIRFWDRSRPTSSSRSRRRQASSPSSGDRSCGARSTTGWTGRSIDVAVNVSAAQIHHGDIVQVVREELSASGFPAHRLEIEVTESVLLADEKRANEQIRGLQKVGVKVGARRFRSGLLEPAISAQVRVRQAEDRSRIHQGTRHSQRQLGHPRLDREARSWICA